MSIQCWFILHIHTHCYFVSWAFHEHISTFATDFRNSKHWLNTINSNFNSNFNSPHIYSNTTYKVCDSHITYLLWWKWKLNMLFIQINNVIQFTVAVSVTIMPCHCLVNWLDCCIVLRLSINIIETRKARSIKQSKSVSFVAWVISTKKKYFYNRFYCWDL